MSIRQNRSKARLGMWARPNSSTMSAWPAWAGISCGHFYKINEALEKFGDDSLVTQP